MVERRKSMKREFVVVILAAFLAAMTSSGASYVSTKEVVAAQEVRIEINEKGLVDNKQTHKEINKTLSELKDLNNEVKVALMRLNTIIAIKFKDNGG